MAFCSSCGSEAQGRFCAKCGSPVAAGPSAGAPGMGSAQAPPPPPPPPQYASQPVSAQTAGLEENVVCALCYVLGLISGVLFLVLAPYNQNRLVRFHAFQSIFLNLAWIVVFTVISVISTILLPIPFLGWVMGLILHLGVGLAALFLWLMLMYKAYNRERWVLPIIGPLAEKQA